MSILFEAFACNCLKTLKIISFRSDNLSRSYLFTSKSFIRMSATLEQLKLRSTQASEVIEKLKKQVEQIKLQTTPAYMAEKAKTLQKENELLKKRVDELKKELESAEANKKPNGTPAVKTENVKIENSSENVANPAKNATKTATPKTATPTTKTETKKAESKNHILLIIFANLFEIIESFETKEPAEIKPENIDVSQLDLRIGKIVNYLMLPFL
jgi:regulator of replication initiation timing